MTENTLKTEITHTLIKPIQYSHKGDMEEGRFVTLKAPTSKNLKECAYLKQSFFRALPQVDANTPTQIQASDKKEDDDLDSDGIMTLLAMSKDVDLDKVLLTAAKLFLSPTAALLEGQTQLLQSHIDQLSMDDLEGMTGKYLANFILASALQKMNSKLSKK